MRICIQSSDDAVTLGGAIVVAVTVGFLVGPALGWLTFGVLTLIYHTEIRVR